MRNTWRNEQLGQQQLQQDEEEEECQRLYEHRDLMHRQQRMEEVANNTSRQDIATYQAQSTNNDNDDFYVHTDSPPPSPRRDHHPPASRPPSPPLPPPPPPPQAIPAGLPRAPTRRFSLGPMNLQCPHRHALHFAAEKLSNSTRIELKFGMCCLSGQICLPPFHIVLSSKQIFASTMQHLHLPLWVSTLIILLLAIMTLIL